MDFDRGGDGRFDGLCRKPVLRKMDAETNLAVSRNGGILGMDCLCAIGNFFTEIMISYSGKIVVEFVVIAPNCEYTVG